MTGLGSHRVHAVYGTAHVFERLAKTTIDYPMLTEPAGAVSTN